MIGHFLTAAALIVAQAGQAGPRSCITKDQAADLALIALPDAVNTISQQCATYLPPTAFLRSGGAGYVERLRAAAEPRRASAMAAFGGLVGNRLPQGVSPEAAMSAMSSGMLAQGLSGRMNAATCAEVNRFVEAFSALPPASLATMLSAGIGIALAMRSAGQAAAGQTTAGQGAARPADAPMGPFCSR
jgi:hypothetical protein